LRPSSAGRTSRRVAADPARKAALDILAAALSRKAGLEWALDSPHVAALGPRDRAFARALAMAALRGLGPIDAALGARLSKPPPEPVRLILRLGLADLAFMDTPDYAAVDSSVALAADDRATRPFRGLVNAVLRRLAADAPLPIRDEDLAPAWLTARWRAAYGEASALAIARRILGEPPTDLTPRDASESPALAEAMSGEALPGGSVRVTGKGRIEDWPGFVEGAWWVQDAAAAVPVRLLAVQPGEAALDLCAAPGGKALQLAAAGAALVAVDRSAARLERLSRALARTGLGAETVAADAETWSDSRDFDAVLLDAPCTSSGVFRRNPDVLWTLRPPDIARLVGLQRRLLDAAARRTRPGGRLVYCVCSLEPEEGEDQARAFLERWPDFALSPAAPGEVGAPAASLAAPGWLRILPHQLEGGLDGFFIARLRRREADVAAAADAH